MKNVTTKEHKNNDNNTLVSLKKAKKNRKNNKEKARKEIHDELLQSEDEDEVPIIQSLTTAANYTVPH